MIFRSPDNEEDPLFKKTLYNQEDSTGDEEEIDGMCKLLPVMAQLLLLLLLFFVFCCCTCKYRRASSD